MGGGMNAREGILQLSDVEVADFLEYNFTSDRDIAKSSPKNQDYADKVYGARDEKASLKLNFNPQDTTGQKILLDAYRNRTVLQSVKFLYAEDRGYYAPDLVTDANAGMLVKSIKINNPNSGFVTADLDVEFSGAWAEVLP